METSQRDLKREAIGVYIEEIFVQSLRDTLSGQINVKWPGTLHSSSLTLKMLVSW